MAIWYSDPRGFVDRRHIGKIWWTPHDDVSERLNVLLRFAIYYAIVALLVSGKTWALVIPVAVAILTYVTARGAAASGLGASAAKPATTRPTTHNPMMNYLLSDMIADVDRAPASNVQDAEVRGEMNAAYTAGVPRDARDVFGRNTGERTFYTMPCTKAVNDADAFARWLFRPNDGMSWKERGVVFHA